MRDSFNNTEKMKLVEIDSDDDLEVNKQTTKENSTTQPELVGEGLLCTSKMSRMGIDTSDLDHESKN